MPTDPAVPVTGTITGTVTGTGPGIDSGTGPGIDSGSGPGPDPGNDPGTAPAPDHRRPGRVASDRAGSIRHGLTDAVLPWALGLLTLVARLATAARGPTDWDSAQYAAAVARFDVTHGRPQPPGYFLYVVARGSRRIGRRRRRTGRSPSRRVRAPRWRGAPPG